MSNKKRQLQVQILDTKTGKHRFVFASKGEVVAVAKHELVLDYWPAGVVKDGEPVLVLEKGQAVDSENVVWDIHKSS